MSDNMRLRLDPRRERTEGPAPTIPGPTTDDDQRTYQSVASDPTSYDDITAIWVDAALGNDANAGTQASPVQTINRGIYLATLLATAVAVVITGTFRERVKIGSPYDIPGEPGPGAKRVIILSLSGTIATIEAPDTYTDPVANSVQVGGFAFLQSDGDYEEVNGGDLAYLFGNDQSQNAGTIDRVIQRTRDGYELEQVSNSFDEVVDPMGPTGPYNTRRYNKRNQWNQAADEMWCLILRGYSPQITSGLNHPELFPGIARDLSSLTYDDEIQIPDTTSGAATFRRLALIDWKEYSLDIRRSDYSAVRFIGLSFGIDGDMLSGVAGENFIAYSIVSENVTIFIKECKIDLWSYGGGEWTNTFEYDAFAWMVLETGTDNAFFMTTQRYTRLITAGGNYYFVQDQTPNMYNDPNFSDQVSWPFYDDVERSQRAPFFVAPDGSNWEEWNPFPLDPSLSPTDIILFRDNYYLTAQDGVYRSENGITGWIRVYTWPRSTAVEGPYQRLGELNGVLFATGKTANGNCVYTFNGLEWVEGPVGPTIPVTSPCELVVGINGRVCIGDAGGWNSFQEGVVNVETDQSDGASLTLVYDAVPLENVIVDAREKCGSGVTYGRKRDGVNL